MPDWDGIDKLVESARDGGLHRPEEMREWRRPDLVLDDVMHCNRIQERLIEAQERDIVRLKFWLVCCGIVALAAFWTRALGWWS